VTEAFDSPYVALAFGLIVGSFANVCIHRLPHGQSVVTPRSYCPQCRKPISAWRNVPVLSYLLLRGRCAGCRAPISPRYPLVELANGVLYFLLASLFGMGLHTVVLMALSTTLLILSLIDLEHQILPDVLTIPGTIAGLLVSFLPEPPTPAVAFASAAGGYLVFMAIAKTWKRLRNIEALGQGDWKLAALLGAFLGWEKLLFTVFFASLSGTLVGLAIVLFHRGSLQHRLPFGTFLGAAGLVALFAGDPAVEWYRSHLQGP
jgi:leader peptidase (prepilin peptidase)/N-methyltransferase